MRILIPGLFAASVFLVLGANVQASPVNDRAAASMGSGQSILMAQAPTGAPSAAPAAGVPSGDDIAKMKKRAATKKRPSKSEIEKIKQHVPPEYHQYLNFR